MGGHDRCEGRGLSADKNQYNLFYRHWGFEYFSSNFFFFLEKNNIFQNNHEKRIFGGHDHFWGNSASDDKNEYNVSGNGVLNAFLKFSPQKNSYWKPKNSLFWSTFSLISLVLLGQLFQKQ